MEAAEQVDNVAQEARDLAAAPYRPSRSYIWAPLLVVLASFAITAGVLLVEKWRHKPVPDFASVEAIEARYPAQLARLRELILLRLAGRGYGTDFLNNGDLFSSPEIVRAAIHMLRDEATVIRANTITCVSDEPPPRPYAQISHPVVYITGEGATVVYRAKVVSDTGKAGWYSLTLDLEKLEALSQGDEQETDPPDEEGAQ